MRVVLQRVAEASVRIDDEVVGAIGPGILLLVGFTPGDDTDRVHWMAKKILGLRIFPDDHGRMNRSLAEVDGDVLVVSQFTLYGDTSKGRRPSFVDAAPPPVAIPLYEAFVEALGQGTSRPPQTGRFGAVMDVALVNDGPVTLVMER